jgi:flagellar basal-body rod protein FlgF
MDGIELMASALHAAKVRLDIAAGNLANVSSDGFHKRLARVFLTRDGLAATAAVDAAQGPLIRTGRSFDLAVVGGGGVLVRDAHGRDVESRAGSFERDAEGRLADPSGRLLLGRDGPIVAAPDATIDAQGVVREGGMQTGRIRLAPGTTVQSGFLEGSNVDAVHEMVEVLGAQRAFETAQKVLCAIDDARGKSVNDVGRVKS